MKTFAALVTLALAGSSFVAAQDGGLNLPECAQKCANSFLQGGIGNCGRDVECICKNKSFLGEIACCLAGDCNEADQKQAVAAAANICKAVGVNDLPTSVACSTAGGATSTGKSSAAATTTGASSSGSATTTPAPTGTAGGSGNDASSTSTGAGPRPTAAAAGLGAVGGLMAAVALL